MATTLSIAPLPTMREQTYEPPALGWNGEPARVVHAVWWAVIVGFAFALAMAYAAYCTRKGGDPDISLTWRGFKVTCHRRR